MKAKTLIAIAVAVLVIAQIVFEVNRRKKAVPSEQPKPQAAAPAPKPRLPEAEPADVSSIVLGGPDGATLVALTRDGSDWVIENLHNAPAEAGRVERFLEAILSRDRKAVPAKEARDLQALGLGEGEGVVVKMRLASGDELPAMLLGLRPEGAFQSAYARPVGGEDVALLPGDPRGEMGLWRNRPETIPDSRAWLDTRVFKLDAADVAALSAVYPDHRIAFGKDGAGEWVLESAAPGGEWSADGLAAWLNDLADFQVADVADAAQSAMAVLEPESHRLDLVLADGAAKWVKASPTRTGDGMLVETSDYPGRFFVLPDWRFRMYFQRMNSLFPRSAPIFDYGDVRFIDIRHGGEHIKIANRDGEWRAIAQPYPLRTDQVERLARLVSGWRPEDFADAGEMKGRPGYGGPLLEVILANGDVIQYRLGGRHPIFPWRYVLVNGSVLLSTDDRECEVLFPFFGQILDLGKVFPGFDAEGLTGVEVSNPAGGATLLSAARREDGEWQLRNPDGEMVVPAADAGAVLFTPLDWEVADVHHDSADGDGTLSLTVRAGERTHSVVFTLPTGRDIPFRGEGGRALLLDRMDFFHWMNALRRLNQAITDAPKAVEVDAVAAETEIEAPASAPEPAVPASDADEGEVDEAVEEGEGNG